MTAFNSKRAAMTLALALGAAASLSGCFPLVVGGAAGGALVATDRRTPGTQLDDQGIEMRANKELRNSSLEPAHIDVTSYNRRVLLTGEVPTEQDKEMAGQMVSRYDNVKAVVNELAVGPNATLSERSSDTLITGKVKASLVDAKDLSANVFKIITERGNVYLMGRVTQGEADRATDIARSVSGVQRVVRILEVVSAQEIGQTPAPAQ